MNTKSELGFDFHEIRPTYHTILYNKNLFRVAKRQPSIQHVQTINKTCTQAIKLKALSN